VYNILVLGIPFLYIGPSPSHITDILAKLPVNWAQLAKHGAVDRVVAHIGFAASQAQKKASVPDALAAAFSQDVLLQRFIEVLESTAVQNKVDGMAMAVADNR